MKKIHKKIIDNLFLLIKKYRIKNFTNHKIAHLAIMIHNMKQTHLTSKQQQKQIFNKHNKHLHYNQ